MHLKINMVSLTTAMLATALLAACAAGMPTQVSNGALVGSNGMTLYTFDKDVAGSGKSTCNDQCAKNWPPLNAVGMDSANGNYTIITRDDGSKQWAFKGKPLYFWSKDKVPGDITGDGFNKVWTIARP